MFSLIVCNGVVIFYCSYLKFDKGEERIASDCIDGIERALPRRKIVRVIIVESCYKSLGNDANFYYLANLLS